MKRRDFTLIFSTYEDGYSLQTFFNKCHLYKESNMVLLIKDAND